MQSKEINAREILAVIDSTQADERRKPEKFSLAGIQKRNLEYRNCKMFVLVLVFNFFLSSTT